MKKPLHFIFSAIFWVWNISFLILVYLGILPYLGIPLVLATLAGIIPVDFFLTLVCLIAVPTICTILAKRRYQKQPIQLIRLFYGVEAPLLLLCAIRLFVLRELTVPSAFVLGIAGICMSAFTLEMLYGFAKRPKALVWGQALAHSLMLIFGLYVGAILLFYAVPAAPAIIGGGFTFLIAFLEALFSSPSQVFSLIFLGLSGLFVFSFSATLFLAMPSGLATLYLNSSYRGLREFAKQYGRNRAILSQVAVITTVVVLFVSFHHQPQVEVLKLLEKPAVTVRDRQHLLAQSDKIRGGLLNAYLSPYRYVSSLEENNHIMAMYKTAFNLPDSLCQTLQNSYNYLLSPFLYQGSRVDPDKAKELYANFFDRPIQKGEQKPILHALQSTFNQDEAKAGLLNIGERIVWLKEQHINLQPQGEWADIEIHEIYENQTTENQEVLYYFSLPESATLTGVWLGDTENRDKRFMFQVSPRGAAQKIYNEQVQRQVDPALLEQVGPRQYRLRAFPIPPKLSRLERSLSIKRPTQMHLWLTYKVMKNPAGWSLPKLGEKRNIFWTKDTKRVQNGQVVREKQEDWLPAFLPTTPQPPKVIQTRVDGYQITAKPLTTKDYVLPKGQKFAVILDSSRSMTPRQKEVVEIFNWLQQNGFADSDKTGNDADLYVTDASGGKPQRIDDLRQFQAKNLTFYGSLSYKEMLRQFVSLRGKTIYDGILLVTDEGSYELSDDRKDLPVMPAPVWMVHLGALPAAYDDVTLKAIQESGGGVASELPTVLQRMATQKSFSQSTISVVDGYAWLQRKVSGETTPTPRSGFAPLAARQLILGLTKDKETEKLSQLDRVHAIAKDFEIVTPYSSMIVLVNDEQREALKQAEAQKDRFDRTVENGNEDLTKPENPLNSASVPEPTIVGGTVMMGIFLAIAHRFRK